LTQNIGEKYKRKTTPPDSGLVTMSEDQNVSENEMTPLDEVENKPALNEENIERWALLQKTSGRILQTMRKLKNMHIHYTMILKKIHHGLI
jgi:hypothetical protein